MKTKEEKSIRITDVQKHSNSTNRLMVQKQSNKLGEKKYHTKEEEEETDLQRPQTVPWLQVFEAQLN